MVRPLLVANFPRIIGGGEVGLLELAESLREKGHRPLIALPGRSTMADQFDRCIISPSVTAAAGDIRHIADDIDLIHAQGAKGLTAAWMARTGKPIIWHARVASTDQLDSFLMRLPNIIIANSHATAKRFEGRANVRVIYNGVKDPVPAEKPLKLSADKKKIGVIGRMTAEKGIQDLLPALLEIVTKRDDVEIAFAGEDSGAIGDLVRAEHRERFRMFGFVPDIAGHLHELDLVVVPSRVEGFGRVAVEAMRAGVPVLARKVGALPEVLADLDDPWLPEDISHWSEKILSRLEHPADQARLKRAGARFDPARHADEIISVYEELLRVSS